MSEIACDESEYQAAKKQPELTVRNGEEEYPGPETEVQKERLRILSRDEESE